MKKINLNERLERFSVGLGAVLFELTNGSITTSAFKKAYAKYWERHSRFLQERLDAEHLERFGWSRTTTPEQEARNWKVIQLKKSTRTSRVNGYESFTI